MGFAVKKVFLSNLSFVSYRLFDSVSPHFRLPDPDTELVSPSLHVIRTKRTHLRREPAQSLARERRSCGQLLVYF